jgi:membrane protease subunit HflK
VYKVDVEEVGIVQRFGRYVRTTQPGLHFKLPAGIERLTKVPIRKVFTEDFGLRTLRPGVRTEYAPSQQYLAESLMLTGDLNVAIVPWIVQYRINDPYRYLFKVRNVRETLRDLSEAIVRQVVGDRSVNEVLNRREFIAVEAKNALQKALDEADTGIQDKQKMIRAAEEQYNREIPAAEGKAKQIVQEALGYKIERVNRAKGDTKRFMAIWKEYKQAPEVTRRRLFLETMSKALPNVGRKVVLDQDLKGILPFLDLDRKGGAQ